MADPACAHDELSCVGDFTHLRQGGETAEVIALIGVICTECGARFGFRGLEPDQGADDALMLDFPSLSHDGVVLRVPLMPPAELALEAMVNPNPEEEHDGNQ